MKKKLQTNIFHWLLTSFWNKVTSCYNCISKSVACKSENCLAACLLLAATQLNFLRFCGAPSSDVLLHLELVPLPPLLLVSVSKKRKNTKHFDLEHAHTHVSVISRSCIALVQAIKLHFASFNFRLGLCRASDFFILLLFALFLSALDVTQRIFFCLPLLCFSTKRLYQRKKRY